MNVSLIERLKSAGLQLYRKEEDLNEYTDKLAGQSIVISGVFTHHSRDEYKDLIEKWWKERWQHLHQDQFYSGG